MIPLYYNEEIIETLSFLPIIVTPLPTMQDTIILGPTTLSKIHDQFIDKLYSEKEQLKDFIFIGKMFYFKKYFCYFLSFPTVQHDQSGRYGLIVSIGLAIPEKKIKYYLDIVSDILLNMFEYINIYYSLNLPNENCTSFYGKILEYFNKNEFENIEMLFQSLIILSKTLKIIERRSNKKEIDTFINSFYNPQINPNYIFYDPQLEPREVIETYFSFITSLSKKIDSIGISIKNDSSEKNSAMIQILPFPSFLQNCTQAQLIDFKGKKLIILK